MVSEEEIIQQCVKQNRKAQKLLFDKYASTMLGICKRYVTNKEEADDILQEGFIKVFLHIQDYAGKGNFEGWLKRIFINTAITYYHKNYKYQAQLDIDDIQETEVEGYELETSDFTIEELLKTINSLPTGYRMVFNLFAVEGYKHKDISEMLKIDVNTSKSQFSRARKLIQKKLESLRQNTIDRTK